MNICFPFTCEHELISDAASCPSTKKVCISFSTLSFSDSSHVKSICLINVCLGVYSKGDVKFIFIPSLADLSILPSGSPKNCNDSVPCVSLPLSGDQPAGYLKYTLKIALVYVFQFRVRLGVGDGDVKEGVGEGFETSDTICGRRTVKLAAAPPARSRKIIIDVIVFTENLNLSPGFGIFGVTSVA